MNKNIYYKFHPNFPKFYLDSWNSSVSQVFAYSLEPTHSPQY